MVEQRTSGVRVPARAAVRRRGAWTRCDAHDAPANGRLKLRYSRDGVTSELEAPVSRRAQEQQIVDIPLLYYYERDRDRVVSWVFFAIYKHTRTKAAREARILWIFKFRSGDSDRLEEVKE